MSRARGGDPDGLPDDEPDDNLSAVHRTLDGMRSARLAREILRLDEPDLRVLLEIYDADALRQVHLLHVGTSTYDQWRALGRTDGQISDSFKHLREAGYIEPIHVAIRGGTAHEQRWQLSEPAIHQLMDLNRRLSGRDQDRPRLRPPGDDR